MTTSVIPCRTAAIHEAETKQKMAHASSMKTLALYRALRPIARPSHGVLAKRGVVGIRWGIYGLPGWLPGERRRVLLVCQSPR